MGAAPILTILKDGEPIKSQTLEGEAMLGRSEACVIRLEDRAISRQHAVFKPVAGGVKVEKKSEFAPLSVNGAECTSAFVKEGDVISIGPYLLKLSMGASAQAQPPVVQAQPTQLVTAMDDSTGASAAASPTNPPDSLALSSPEISLEKTTDTAAAAPADPAGEHSSSLPPIETESSSPSQDIPSDLDFSLGIKMPEGSDPIDVGEIHIDEEAKTKLLPAAKVSAKLVLPPESANITELEIDKEEVSIGRGKDCDVVLDDKKASRRHAIIRRAGVNFSIKDLQSANGTYVNGSKIEEQSLSGDDIIKIGNVEFRFLVLSADYVKNQQDFMPVPQEPDDVQMDFADEGEAAGAPVEQPYEAPPAQAQPYFGARPGAEATGGVSGLAGIGGVTTKKKTLIQMYRELPPRRKAIWTFIIIAVLYFAFIDEDPPKAPQKSRPAIVSAQKGPATFENLTPEQKKFVESQHALAFDYYRNKDYDKAIFEIDKIFSLIPDYKDSREIERYAKEGKRKLEALEEEKHKQEEEAKLKLKIAELVADAKTLMDQKKYDQTGELFFQILALDPDNQQIADWRKQVDAYEEQKRIEEEQRQVQAEINARAWDFYKQGMALKEHKKYADAVGTFRRIAQIGATDKRAERSAAARIRDIQKIIADLRDPVLASAKQAEDSQDYANAYKLYEKSTEIDPSYPAGYAGMSRVRGVLHDRAKALYIEAVLAESYTDFDMAKKKYRECLDIAPKDDIYHDRALRKLSAFFHPGDGGSPGGSGPDNGGDAAGSSGSNVGDSGNTPGSGDAGTGSSSP